MGTNYELLFYQFLVIVLLAAEWTNNELLNQLPMMYFWQPIELTTNCSITSLWCIAGSQVNLHYVNVPHDLLIIIKTSESTVTLVRFYFI